MLNDVVADVHAACSIAIVLTFETIGPSFTGDILVDNIDQIEDWAFHANGYVALVDAYFDYKHERKDKLDQHVERRQQRVRFPIPIADKATNNPMDRSGDRPLPDGEFTCRRSVIGGVLP